MIEAVILPQVARGQQPEQLVLIVRQVSKWIG
jgi:hypothetical protein